MTIPLRTIKAIEPSAPAVETIYLSEPGHIPAPAAAPLARARRAGPGCISGSWADVATHQFDEQPKICFKVLMDIKLYVFDAGGCGEDTLMITASRLFGVPQP